MNVEKRTESKKKRCRKGEEGGKEGWRLCATPIVSQTEGEAGVVLLGAHGLLRNRKSEDLPILRTAGALR